MGNNMQQRVTPRAAQIVAAAVMASNVVYVLVGVLVPLAAGGEGLARLDTQTAQLVQTLLLAVGVMTSLASFVIRKAFLEPAILRQADTLPNRTRVVIISMAMAESAGILGLVCALMTGQLAIPAILWACSIATGILHFPTRAWLESAPQSR